MEMNMDSTELLIPAFFGVFACWFVFHIRRRMHSADKTFASTHRKITRRLAGGDATLEIQEKESKAITTDDWTRGRRQVILCSGILILVVTFSVVSCIGTG